MRLVACVVLGLVVACGGERPAGDPHVPTVENLDAALARAGGFLAAQQGEDGALRSRPYAALRDGWSLTPLAALALRVTPERPAFERAAAFVATLVDGEAVRGVPAVSYPLHAYALGALVLGTPERVDGARATRDRLLAAVRRHQLAGANGWRAGDLSFGGWGYAPRVPVRPAGEVVQDDMLTANLSATLLAIGALGLAGTPPTDPALVDALGFVRRCQGSDGGFHFSPALPDGNKAGRGPDGYRSYGSMTADGVRALMRLGVRHDEPALARGLLWLERHFDATKNPGAFEPVDEIRQASSYYYWTWSAAHALEHAGRPVLKTARGDVRWAEALAAELLRRQRPDGSWRNDATEMREDDPVIATSFAVAALAVCRSVISGRRVSHAAWR